MTQTACQYAIVRFAPFVETGEFANVGVLLLAPDAGYFGFELETRRYGRITKFFEGVEARHYKTTMDAVQCELERARKLLDDQGFSRRQLVQNVFDEITRTRESIVRFSAPRVVLAQNPKAKLHELFGYYVQRNFVNRQYRETVLENGIRRWLKAAHLQRLYEARTVGDASFEVKFPFVAMAQDRPQKAIKPLYLGQDRPTRIIEHGANWAFRVQELRRREQLPDRVLFAVDGPGDKPEANRAQAFNDTWRRLEDADVAVIAADNRDRVMEFAAV